MGGLGQDESLQKEQQAQGTWDGKELVGSEGVAQQEVCDRSGVRWRYARSWVDCVGPWRPWAGFD